MRRGGLPEGLMIAHGLSIDDMVEQVAIAGAPDPYYRGYSETRGGGYYRRGRFRTWNKCQ
jgi:hypothetical protein